MTITSMIHPDIIVLDDTVSTKDICSLVKQKQRTYDAINMVCDVPLFNGLITSLTYVIDKRLLCHVFVVDNTHSLRLNRSYGNVAVSLYEGFYHLLVVLALQVSDYHTKKAQYRLGYFHAFLAKKYLESFDKSIFFNPAIHFKIAYAYKHLNAINSAKMHVNEALTYTQVIFDTYQVIDVALTVQYMGHLCDQSMQDDAVKTHMLRVLRILESVRAEMPHIQLMSLASIYERLLMSFSWDDAIKIDLLNKEFYIRQSYLEKDDWPNRLRFAIICKLLGDYYQLNNKTVKAHYMYLTSLSLFHFAYTNKKTELEPVERLLETLDLFYDNQSAFLESSIVLSIKNYYN